MTLETFLAKRDRTMFHLYAVLAVIIVCLAFMFLNLGKTDTSIPGSFWTAGFIIVVLSVLSVRLFAAINSWTKQILGWEKIVELLYDGKIGWQKALLDLEKECLPVEDALVFFNQKGMDNKLELYQRHLIHEHAVLSAKLSTFLYESSDRRSCEQVLDGLESTPTWKHILPKLRMNHALKDDSILDIRPGDMGGACGITA